MDDPRPTDASLAARRLREEIVRGQVEPGSKLKLVPLAQRYSMSRGPLREAASRLAAEGLLVMEEQRGFRVASISREDLLDLTRTRQRIELLALQDAMEHGDLDWEGRVIAAVHRLNRVTGGSDREAFVQQHSRFHAALVSTCPSAYLLEFRDRLYEMTERYRHLAADRAGPSERDIRGEHLALADAAVSRDVERATSLLADHLDQTAQRLLAAYPELFG